jgi:hypothetical protein
MDPLNILESVLLFLVLTASITKLILKDGLTKLVIQVVVVITQLLLTIFFVVTDKSFLGALWGILTGMNFTILALRISEKEEN